jgi:hypothetical protein
MMLAGLDNLRTVFVGMVDFRRTLAGDVDRRTDLRLADLAPPAVHTESKADHRAYDEHPNDQRRDRHSDDVDTNEINHCL